MIKIIEIEAQKSTKKINSNIKILKFGIICSAYNFFSYRFWYYNQYF